MKLAQTLKTLAAGAALAVASFASSAAVWTQTTDPNPNVLVPPSITLDIDLAAARFNLGSDLVTGFTFTLVTYDDSDRGFFTSEWVFADLPGLLADGLWFNTGTFSTGTSLLGDFSLNATGHLIATVSAPVGDFIFDSATLEARGIAGNVPEPASLALVGMALGRRGHGRPSPQVLIWPR